MTEAGIILSVRVLFFWPFTTGHCLSMTDEGFGTHTTIAEPIHALPFLWSFD